jgi:hypothetical protein
MAVVRWRFYDPLTLEDEEFPLNPQELTLPEQLSNITVSDTVAPDGKAVLAEGVPEVQKISWSGVLLDLDAKDFFTRWKAKKYQVRLTDDYGDEWWIYITKFAPTRPQTRPSHPDLHRYTFEALILDWPT